MGPVVADASVLIALSNIGQLDLLEPLVGEIVIPPEVAREAAPGVALPPWVRIRALGRPLDLRVSEASLHRGESEAVSLALELTAERLILDDLPARKLAKKLGLSIVGTAGLVFLAKRKGLIAAVRPVLDALRARGFRLRQDVYEEILNAASEGGAAL